MWKGAAAFADALHLGACRPAQFPAPLPLTLVPLTNGDEDGSFVSGVLRPPSG